MQVSLGTITSGNSPGDTHVAANIGTIPAGVRVQASFLVTINNPLPLGVTQVSNQAEGFTFGFPSGVTNDPSTAIPDDPTVTQVTDSPVGTATKVASLFHDADANGLPSPGDTLLYRIDFTNTGNTPLSGITAVDVPDPNTTLVVGSVQLSLGTITSGNDPGDTEVGADIGTIPPGVRVQASFLVTINDPLPEGVTQVSNQAQGFSFGFPTGGTDDPSTPEPNDPTVVNVFLPPPPSPTVSETPTPSATETPTPTVTPTPTETPTPGPPVLEIEKDAALFVASGGVLVYSLTYRNSGGATATGVVLTETVPDQTTFHAAASTPGWSCPDGSPAGTACTLAGDDLPAGESRSVLFAVRVDDAPDSRVIDNTVSIAADVGSGGAASRAVRIEAARQAPILAPWVIVALLGLLAALGRVGLRGVSRRASR